MKPETEASAEILIVDDERNMRRVLSAMLTREGYDSIEAADGREALARLERTTPICVITDLKMPDIDGLELLERIRAREPAVPVIMITAHGTVDTAVKAMKQGAFDYLTKPFDQAELLNVVRKATRSAAGARKEPTPSLFDDAFVIGDDPAMDEVYKLVDRVASTDINVLITGESGTGKELVARAIHKKGARASQTFLAINCAAIPDDLTESELFGYEKGAFTGAVISKPGRFELADKGTLFLDEIGTLSPKVQGKLLRVLQERSFERVGGIKTIHVDTRLIAATNTDMKAQVEQEKFREDLYYRLNVVQIALPPLRERPDDIMPLARHFVGRFAKKMNRPVEGIDDAVAARFLTYDWPGNIRELENAIERAVLMADAPLLRLVDFPPEILDEGDMESAPLGEGSMRERVKDATARIERQMILDALEKTGNNITQAAKVLGLSRKGLQIKLKALGLRGEEP